jgi:endonuclease/exonuclease/phosphatase family metal-dependent hydrolase
MWFDKKNRAQRTETLLNEVRCYDPDILALQEVVPESLEIIIAKMKPTYYVIGVNPSGFPTGYDTLILSKFPPIEWDRYYLPKTKMGRNLLLVTLQTQTRQITVGTFHLESVFLPKTKEAEELKESQLKYIYAISPINSILMGDTNLVLDNDPYPFPSQESPKTPNNPPIIDVFYVPQPQPLPLPLSQRGIPPNDEPNATPNMIDLGAEDIEFQESDVHSTSPPNIHNLGVCPFLKEATYCGRTNKHVKNKSIQSRLDRIYVKIKRNSLKVHFYGLTGTFTQPSDHFGVFAQLEF